MKPPSPAAAPLDAHLGFWLRLVSNQVSLRFQQGLEAEGVSVAEWVALRLLYDQAPARPAQLIQTLGMTKGATSKLVTRLEDKGLARRIELPGRAREQALALTPRGRALVPRLAARADANDAHFFGHLPAPQQRALMRALQDLARHHGLQDPPTD